MFDTIHLIHNRHLRKMREIKSKVRENENDRDGEKDDDDDGITITKHPFGFCLTA